MDFFYVSRSRHAEVLNISELEDPRVRRLRRFNTKEVSALHVVEVKDWPGIRLAPGNFNVRQLDIVYVADKEAARGDVTEPIRFRISLVHLWHHPFCHFACSTSAMFHIQVVDFNVFDRIRSNAHDESRTAVRRHGVVADNFADNAPLRGPYGPPRRTPHAASQA